MSIEIIPVPARTIFWTLFLCLGLPIGVLLAAMLAVRGELVARWILVIIAVAAPVAIGIFWSLSRNEVRVSGDQLIVKAGFYKVSMPTKDVQVARAQRMEGRDAGDLASTWRVNGIGLPGFRAGWFKLRNGERAFHLVTDAATLAVPTNRGYWLMLSVREPDAFLAAVAPAGK